MCDPLQQRLQAALSSGRDVAPVCTAAGVADVVVDASVGQDLVRAAELHIQAALSGQDVDGAEVAPGAGAALPGQTVGGDVGAGGAMVLQGAEQTQQGVCSGRWEDQRG